MNIYKTAVDKARDAIAQASVELDSAIGVLDEASAYDSPEPAVVVATDSVPPVGDANAAAVPTPVSVPPAVFAADVSASAAEPAAPAAVDSSAPLTEGSTGTVAVPPAG
jgi:hypothetical protein